MLAIACIFCTHNACIFVHLLDVNVDLYHDTNRVIDIVISLLFIKLKYALIR